MRLACPHCGYTRFRPLAGQRIGIFLMVVSPVPALGSVWLLSRYGETTFAALSVAFAVAFAGLGWTLRRRCHAECGNCSCVMTRRDMVPVGHVS